LIIIAGGSYVYHSVKQIETQSKQVVEQSSATQSLESKTLVELKKINKQQALQLKQITDEKQQLQEAIDKIREQKYSGEEMESSADDAAVAQVVTEQTLAEPLESVLPFLPPRIQPVNEQMAQQELLQRWGLDYQPDSDGSVCDFAGANNLRCEIQKSSGWWPLRVVNRPVILKLASEQGQEVYGVLVGLNKQHVLINFSGEEFLLKRSTVSQYWSGEYFLLWQAPPNYEKPLSLSMKGTQVQWLLTNLAKLDNLDLIVPPDVVFDEQLKIKIKEFQQQNSLLPDGVAGLQTLITLNRLVNASTPTLSSRSAG